MSGTGGTPEPQGRPGRYNRSFNALIGSMIVTVLVVLAFVGFRGVFSRDLDVQPGDIDYLQTVEELQAGDVSPVYPSGIPDDWSATTVVFDPAEPAAFGVSFLNEDGQFLGVRQDDATADELLATFVTPDQPTASTTEAFEATGSVAPTWQGWEDDGGDHAFTAEVDGRTVLVFGAAPVDQLEDVVESLTTAPVQE